MFFGPSGNLLFEKQIMGARRVGFIRSSPRADRLIWEESRNGSLGVVITDVDGRVLWEHPIQIQLWALALSNDGSQLALQTHRGISTIDISSKHETFLLQAEPGTTQARHTVGWSPTGERIVYEDGGRIQIYDRQSGNSSFLVNGCSPAWSPDGQWIAYRTIGQQAMLIAPDEKSGRVILKGSETIGSLKWSPCSKYILFADDSATGFVIMATGRILIYRVRDGVETVFRNGAASGSSVIEAWAWCMRPR